jgi:hypothetical protein
MRDRGARSSLPEHQGTGALGGVLRIVFVISRCCHRDGPLQWYETGIYLAVALALAGFCLWRIRPGRPAEPDIHRPRASRPAPALERSP